MTRFAGPKYIFVFFSNTGGRRNWSNDNLDTFIWFGFKNPTTGVYTVYRANVSVGRPDGPPGFTHHNSEFGIDGNHCFLVKPKLLD